MHADSQTYSIYYRKLQKTLSIFFVLQSRILTRRQSFFLRLFLFLQVCWCLCQLSVCCKSVTEKKQCSTPCSSLAYNKHILFLSLNINWFFAGQYKMFVIKYYFILLQIIKNVTQTNCISGTLVTTESKFDFEAGFQERSKWCWIPWWHDHQWYMI